MDYENSNKLDHYEELEPEERANVENAVKHHPEHLDDLLNAQHLASLIDSARSFNERPVPDLVLSYMAVMRMIDQEPREQEMRTVLSQIEREMQTNTELHARYEKIRRRMEELDDSSHAGDQFRELVGYNFAEELTTKWNSALERAGDDSNGAPKTSKSQDQSAAVDRPPRGSRERNVLKRRLAYGTAILAAAIVTIAFVVGLSQALTPEHKQLAYLDSDELRVEGFGETTRGEEPGQNSGREFLDGLSALDAAKSSTLGLYPRFDLDEARSARANFSSVVEITEEGSFMHTEALFWLAQAHLILGETAEARAVLEQVVNLNGRMAPEALNQLDRLN